MSTLIDTLNNISFNLPIYVGLLELMIGTIGNGLTIVLFSQAPLRATRTVPCIIAMAVISILFLNYTLISRAIAATYRQPDMTFGNSILCVLRYLIPYNSTCIVLWLLSWLAIDRYLCSCRQQSRRAWSTKKILRNVTIVVFLGSFLFNCPYLIFAKSEIDQITGKKVCAIQNSILFQFYSYFHVPVVFTVQPVVFLGLFAILTIRNIRATRQTTNRLERQMTRVLITQIVVAVCCTTPIAINNMYSLFTSTYIKSPLRQAIEQVVGLMTLYTFLVLFCSNFYIYCIGSREVREKLKSSVCCFKRTNNQVIPKTIQMQQLPGTTADMGQLLNVMHTNRDQVQE